MKTKIKRKYSESGFTLIELVVVLMIMSLFSALAVPHLVKQTDSARYRAGFKKISSMVNLARFRAVETGVDQKFGLDIDTGKISIEAKNSKKPYITTYLQNDFKNNGLKITCIKKNGAVIVSGRPVIIFHPDGTAEHADITLACSTDIRETVTFELRAADSRLSAF